MKTLVNPVRVSFIGRLNGAIGVCYYIEDTVSHGSQTCMELALYKGDTASGSTYESVSDFRQLTACYTSDDLTRVNNDVNGNPRYVIHYLALLTDQECKEHGFDTRYDYAVKKAKKLFGGRRFHNKQYGGGIVFQSYSVDTELRIINEIHNGPYRK